MDNGLEMYVGDKENRSGLMELDIKDNGKMVKQMEKVLFYQLRKIHARRWRYLLGRLER